jgi:hypothetical protein
MAVLTAAVVIIAVLSLGNLMLTITAIRRLTDGAPSPDIVLPPAEVTAIPDFDAVTVTGTPVSAALMAGGPGVAGFFAADCPACHDQLSAFAEFARTVSGGPRHVLAVVAAGTRPHNGIVAALEGTASIVVEPDDGPVARAFRIQAFPSFFTTDGRGLIRGPEMTVRDLAAAPSA